MKIVEQAQIRTEETAEEAKTNGESKIGGRLVPEHDSGYGDPGNKLELPVMQGKFKQGFQATIPAVLDDV